MATKRFQTINTNNYELETVQSNVSSSLDSITSLALLNGVILEDIVLQTGNNSIAHKLSRQPIGYLILKQNAASNFYSEEDSNTLKDRILILNSSAACTVSLYVF